MAVVGCIFFSRSYNCTSTDYKALFESTVSYFCSSTHVQSNESQPTKRLYGLSFREPVL